MFGMAQIRTEYLAKKREYRLQHRDELNAKKRIWHSEHKVDQNEKSLAYFSENHDELLVKNREYKADHREEMSGNLNLYRAKHRAPGGKIYEFNEWLDELKHGPCSDCRGSFQTCVMDWDHVRGKKLFSIGAVRSQWATEKMKQRILDEVAKCDLVCANCHRIRTKNRRSGICRYIGKTPAISGGSV